MNSFPFQSKVSSNSQQNHSQFLKQQSNNNNGSKWNTDNAYNPSLNFSDSQGQQQHLPRVSSNNQFLNSISSGQSDLTNGNGNNDNNGNIRVLRVISFKQVEISYIINNNKRYLLEITTKYIYNQQIHIYLYMTIHAAGLT